MANLDTFIGGAGDDSYFVDDSADAIIENPNAGTDIVQAEVSYTLPANVENLILLNVGNINATGNALNNVLTGNDYANRLNGLSGQDTLIGGFGDDIYVMDDVGDVIVENLEEGIDTVETNLNYTLIANLENLILTGTANLNGTGNELNNTLNGNSGNNTLAGGNSSDILVGEAGTDSLLGEQGNDQLYGGLDEDALDAGTGADYLEGNEGDDRLYAAVTNVNINANPSQTTYQIITSDLEADIFRGGIGSDIIIAGNSNDDIDGGTGANVVYANGGNDTIRGGISNYIDAGDGDDDVRTGGSAIITGGAGNDYLEAADNLNNISGGAGNDWIVGSGVLPGGTGDDLFGVDLIPPTLYGPYEVTDFVAGGAEDSMDNYHLLQDLRARGFDASNIGEWLRLVQDGADTKLQVDKSGASDGVGFQDIAVFKNTNLSQFNGSDFSHYITLGGGSAANINQTVDASLLDRTGTYMGKDGNDTLVGLTAPNQIDGGLGDDVIMGQDSSDVLFGDFGNDELHGNGGNDNILGGTGNDSIFGGTGDDGYFYDVNYKRVVFAGGLRGEEGNDYLEGGDGQDYLDGGSGNDTLHGGADNDSLYGRTGTDQLYGEAGDDSLSSDDGNDYLSGGAGNDTLQANGDNSVLLGGDDNDSLSLTGNNSVVDGGIGDDSITLGYYSNNNTVMGGVGNDSISITGNSNQVDAGEGDNIVVVDGGNNQVLMGSGADTITVYSHDYNVTDVGSIATGAGNDVVQVGFYYGDNSHVILDMGSGNDRIDTETPDGYHTTLSGTFTLGLGNDEVELSLWSLERGVAAIVITDFQAGAGGDKLDLTAVHTRLLERGWDGISDPYSAGLLRISQSGSDTILEAKLDDGYFHNLAILQNVAPETLTLSNFISPFSPVVSGNKVPVLSPNMTIVMSEDTVGDLALQAPLDPDGGIPVITVVQLPTNGYLRLADDSTLTEGQLLTPTELTGLRFVSDINFFGTPSDFIYQVVDNENSIKYGRLSFQVTPVNDAPTITAYTELSSAVVANAPPRNINNEAGLWFEDVDSNTLTSATLTMSNFTAGDVLTINTTDTNITANFNALGNQITLTGIASLDTYRTVLATLAFAATPSGGSNTRHMTTSVSDGELSNAIAYTVPIAAALNSTPDDDILIGIANDEYIDGLAGNDWIEGNAGNDTLIGSDGNDTLIGGLGNDSLQGYGGADTYLFNQGDGQDFIDNGYADGTDTQDVISFGNINSTDVAFTRDLNSDYGDLVISVNGSTDSVRIYAYYYTNVDTTNYANVNVSFADGVVYNRDDIRAHTDSNENIYGTESNDTLYGGLGNDSLYGYGGADTYLFNQGDGQDFIDNGYADGIDTQDLISFGNINSTDVTFTRDLNSAYGELVISVNGTTDSVRLYAYYDGNVDTSAYANINLSFADGVMYNRDDIRAHSYSNENIYGTDSDDTLYGGLGNDSLQGYGGADTYLFNLGDGQDYIDNGYADGAETQDVISFGNINSTNVTFTRDLNSDYGDLVISVNGTTDSVRLYAYYYTNVDTSAYANINVSFADGVVYNREGIRAHTNSDENIYGSDSDDTLYGGLGNDSLQGYGGADTYLFNRGDGQDYIDNGYADGAETQDVISFGNINSTDVTFTRDLNSAYGDLVITVNGTTDSVRLYAYYYTNVDTTAYANLNLNFADGVVYNREGIRAHTNSDENIYGSDSDDTLYGGLGNDSLYGYGGNNTYIYNRGDGNDLIDNYGGISATLVLGFGITANDILFSRDYNSSGLMTC